MIMPRFTWPSPRVFGGANHRKVAMGSPGMLGSKGYAREEGLIT